MSTQPLPINTYIFGDVARLQLTIAVASTLTDPTSLTLKIEPPSTSGVPEYQVVYGVDPGLIRDSAGVYHYNVALAYAGRWKYRWVSLGSTSTAPGSGATERYLEVRASTLTVP